MKHRLPFGVRLIYKSILDGVAVAGVVNTVAPGLFSTLMGYVAGSLRGTDFTAVMVELSLFSIGAFSTPMLSSYGILALGGLCGLLSGLFIGLITLIVRAVRRKIRHADDDDPPFAGKAPGQNFPQQGQYLPPQ